MSKATVLNFGSINIDHIYRVPHFVAPGETLSSDSLTTVLGGKGANQSVAVARAGAEVSHIGQICTADNWAIAKLAEAGVNTEHIRQIDSPSGHAIIQVDAEGENSILLFGGANQRCTLEALEEAIRKTPDAQFLLLQNECNLLEAAILLAKKHELKVILNPAPMTEDIADLPLAEIDLLIVNQIEGQVLSGASESADIIPALSERLPATDFVLTLGSQGAVYCSDGESISQAPFSAEVVDTTAAGDTFVGYFVAGLVQNLSADKNLARACSAAALSIETLGAIPSIPTITQVEERWSTS